jgi:hypothetical protein
MEHWSLFGLDVKIPRGARLERHELKAGSTKLFFSAKGASITAERWGFGQQLLAKHDFADWATAIADMRTPILEVGDSRVELSQTGFLRTPVTALAMYYEDRNLIMVIRSSSRLKEWRPAWDWFN